MENKVKRFDEDLLIAIFLFTDDACQAMQSYVQQHWIGKTGKRPGGKPTRQPKVSESEIMTLLIFYHHSGYKCFQYFYQRFVLTELRSFFPQLPSYERFLQLIERVSLPMWVLAKLSCGERAGIYFIDSKKVPVCENPRIHSHKVFAHSARRGKSSTGWFYGFKLHLVINHKGEIVDFRFTAANTADNNHSLLKELLIGLKGLCFGDKGYLTTLWHLFHEQGLKLVTKTRKKMKNALLTLQERLLLAKRAVIESVNDILTSVLDLEHSRHRKPVNAFTHCLACLVAYAFYEDKPAVNIPKRLLNNDLQVG